MGQQQSSLRVANPRGGAPPPPPKFFKLIPETHIDFIGLRAFFYILSAALVGSTIFLLILKGGPSLGVDFAGGIVVHIDCGLNTTIETMRENFVKEGLDAGIQSLGEQGQFLARLKRESEESGLDDRLQAVLGRIRPDGGAKILSKEFVGAVVGEKLRYQALMAIALSFLGIIVYVGFRFRNLVWGIAGVVALVHDVIVALGFITVLGYEVDLVVVAALLTLAGYSINDTVVIFDRLRERIRLYPRETFRDAINCAVNGTLSRTVITAGATWLTVLALVIWGGMHLRPFATTLLVGIIAGSYSTVGVASGLVYTWASWTGDSKK